MMRLIPDRAKCTVPVRTRHPDTGWYTLAHPETPWYGLTRPETPWYGVVHPWWLIFLSKTKYLILNQQYKVVSLKLFFWGS
jgi:hypothetical protein